MSGNDYRKPALKPAREDSALARSSSAVVGEAFLV